MENFTFFPWAWNIVTRALNVLGEWCNDYWEIQSTLNDIHQTSPYFATINLSFVPRLCNVGCKIWFCWLLKSFMGWKLLVVSFLMRTGCLWVGRTEAFRGLACPYSQSSQAKLGWAELFQYFFIFIGQITLYWRFFCCNFDPTLILTKSFLTIHSLLQLLLV